MYYSFAFVTTNLRPAVYLQIRLQSPRVRIHILKFSREKNSTAVQFVVLCSFLAASRVLLLSKPSGTFCVVFCRLMFRFVIMIIVVGSWL